MTYMLPVARSVEEARVVAKERFRRQPHIPCWDILVDTHDLYYVVPPRKNEDTWESDPDFQKCGTFVERVSKSKTPAPRGRKPKTCH